MAKVTGLDLASTVTASEGQGLRRAGTAVFLWVVLVLIAACGADDTAGPDAETTGGQADTQVRLLAIDDSVLDFSGDRSTPEEVGAALESRGVSNEVVNRAIGGSCLVNCGDPDADQIPARYIDGDWTHVLISGGGNDLGEVQESCSSPDVLMSADLGSGAMVDLVDRVPADVTVLLYGYSGALPDDRYCPEIWNLMDRYAAFAADRPNVVLADAGTVTGPDTAELWADPIHPDEAGSEVIGAMIADLIVVSLDG